MSGIWAAIAKAAVKVAVYAAEHPDQVKELVNVVAEAKKA